MTADYSFLSYYPYFGFQGLTSHYANPLAQFDKRAAAIESWSKLKAADPFIHALDTLPWAPPTVFLMRHGGSAGASPSGLGSTYTLRLAEDVYPNQPNVRRYTVELNASMFADPRFTVTTIRPVRVGRPQTLMAPKAADTGQLASSSVSRAVDDAERSDEKELRSIASDGGTTYRAARIVAVVAGLLGALLAIATPLLPVKQTTAQLNWPQNGVLGSVEAPLIGYVATDLNISIPCQAAAGLAGPGDSGKTVLLSTVPKQAPKAVDRGLLIERANDDLVARCAPPSHWSSRR